MRSRVLPLVVVALLAGCSKGGGSSAPGTGGGPGSGAGGGGAAAGGTGGGQTVQCAAGLTACGSSCADLTVEPSHCGRCDHACAAMDGCTAGACSALPTDCRQTPCPARFYCDLSNGACKPGCAVDGDCGTGVNTSCDVSTHACGCATGFHDCGGACVSSTALTSCGTSCSACPSDPHGAAMCDGNACQTMCGAGYLLCGGACVACADPNGTASCAGNACSISCQSGYNLCGGKCAAPSDTAACGPSCTVCPSDPHGTVTCDGKACQTMCSTGYLLCGGVCVACADPNGAASCNGNACSISCKSGYNLCGGKCAAATDPRACGASCTVCPSGTNQVATCQAGMCSAVCATGTSVCKGECVTGGCTWNSHVVPGTIGGWSVDVDGSGVVHAATTYQLVPSYHRIAGPGAPVSESLSSVGSCFEGSGTSKIETRVIVAADGSGKARIVCIGGAELSEVTWNGSAWTSSPIFTSTSYGLQKLTGGGNRIAFEERFSGNYVAQLAQLAGGAWTAKSFAMSMNDFVLFNVLGGGAGAAEVAWVYSGSQSVDVVTESGNGFDTGKALPSKASLYALDGSGNVVGVSTDLMFHTYAAGAWINEVIAPGTTNAIDLVIDGYGMPRVAWIDGTGAHLATRVGSPWNVESVSTVAGGTGIDLAVGPNGKVAVGVRYSTPSFTFTVFE